MQALPAGLVEVGYLGAAAGLALYGRHIRAQRNSILNAKSYFTGSHWSWLRSEEAAEEKKASAAPQAVRKTKMTYNAKDFWDYCLMSSLCVAVTRGTYGPEHPFTKLVLGTCVCFVGVFALRQGVTPGAPLVQDAPRAVRDAVLGVPTVTACTLANMRSTYFFQLAWFLGEGLFLRLLGRVLGSVLPGGSGAAEGPLALAAAGSRSAYDFATFGLFYTCFGVTMLVRSIAFLDHLRNHNHVFGFLRKTGWAKSLHFIGRSFDADDAKSMPQKVLAFVFDTTTHFVGLTHAFLTGTITHILTVVPWYFALCFSWVNVAQGLSYAAKDAEVHPAAVVAFFAAQFFFWYLRATGGFLRKLGVMTDLDLISDFHQNELNDWYIKDHWLGHHDKFSFNYLHGPHHDALPISVIAVADNGPLEGTVRHFCGHFDSFQVPPLTFWHFTKQIVRDMVGHQYVPGVFPFSFSVLEHGVHHVEHHYLSLYPVGNGIEGDPDPRNNCEVESWLSTKPGAKASYRSDNQIWLWFCEQVLAQEDWHIKKFGINLEGKVKAAKPADAKD